MKVHSSQRYLTHQLVSIISRFVYLMSVHFNLVKLRPLQYRNHKCNYLNQMHYKQPLVKIQHLHQKCGKR